MHTSIRHEHTAAQKTETIHGMVFVVENRHARLCTEEGHGFPIPESHFAFLKYMLRHMDEDVDCTAAFRKAVLDLGITQHASRASMDEHIERMVKALNSKLDGVQGYKPIRRTRNGKGLYLPRFNPVPRI